MAPILTTKEIIMTCIIAITEKDKVHMVGDLCGSNGFQHKNYTKNVKIFKNGEFLIGHTDTYRLGQILQYSWCPPKKSADYDEDVYIYKHIVDSLKKTLDENSYGKKDGVCFIGGNFLIGYKGRIFEVQSDMSILEHEKFASVGCGEYMAESSLATLLHTGSKLNPEKMLATALLITSSLVTGVSSEYTYLSE